jgi:hypothetical protein
MISNNLVINSMASWSLLNTDQTPASFWMTNPNNMWVGNHAAGSDRYGFWLSLTDHPIGPSATNTVCPKGVPFGLFTDNVAHSNAMFGLRIWNDFVPRTNPCGPIAPLWNTTINPPVTAVFKNFLGYMNHDSAVNCENLGDVRFVNFTVMDSV